MIGSGKFAKAVNQGNKQLSEALDQIPLEGLVTQSHYDAYLTCFRQAISIQGGTETRLLAMKQPDVFLCLDGKNERLLRKRIGIRQKVTPDNYCDEVIASIQESAWWQAPKPTLIHRINERFR